MKYTSRNHGVTFKAQAALAAVKEDRTVAELAEQFGIHSRAVAGQCLRGAIRAEFQI